MILSGFLIWMRRDSDLMMSGHIPEAVPSRHIALCWGAVLGGAAPALPPESQVQALQLDSSC
jgi:hypothetical protein